MTNQDCEECEGSGIVLYQDRYSSDGVRESPCEKCNGEYPEYEPESEIDEWYEDLE